MNTLLLYRSNFVFKSACFFKKWRGIIFSDAMKFNFLSIIKKIQVFMWPTHFFLCRALKIFKDVMLDIWWSKAL